MINIIKLTLSLKVTMRGSLMINKSEVDYVPDVIVKDDIVYIIDDYDCNFAYYRHSNATISTLVKVLLKIYPNTKCAIVYV